MIHMLRQLTKDDEKWRQILRKMNSKFYHQTVTTKQIEDFLSKEIGRDLNPFFNQYLRDTRIPVLEYKITEGKLKNMDDIKQIYKQKHLLIPQVLINY